MCVEPNNSNSPTSTLLMKYTKQFTLKMEGKYKNAKIEDFEVIKHIGRGAYAEVKEAVFTPTKDLVALKIYEKSKLLDPLRRNNLIREIRILESLNHPNIMKIHNCMDAGNKVIMALELIKGKSLKTHLYNIAEEKFNSISEVEAIPLFKQMISAVAYCHSKGVAHRDLKLDNVLVTPQNVIKIIDFGFASWTKSDKKCRVFCGTPAYMAPEIITKTEYLAQPADVWALGVMLYTMLCGCFPFQSMYKLLDIYRQG